MNAKQYRQEFKAMVELLNQAGANYPHANALTSERLAEFIKVKKTVIEHLCIERDDYQKHLAEAEVHLNTAIAELHFAGIDTSDICPGIRMLRSQRDAAVHRAEAHLSAWQSGYEQQSTDCLTEA